MMKNESLILKAEKPNKSLKSLKRNESLQNLHKSKNSNKNHFTPII